MVMHCDFDGTVLATIDGEALERLASVVASSDRLRGNGGVWVYSRVEKRCGGNDDFTVHRATHSSRWYCSIWLRASTGTKRWGRVGNLNYCR